MSSYSATAATRRGSVVPPLSGIDRPVLQPLPDSCDVLIAGTGLVESILAAALAWQGSRVIHIDHNPYYGDASSILGIEQLQDWVNHVNSSKGIYCFGLFLLSFSLSSSSPSPSSSPSNLPQTPSTQMPSSTSPVQSQAVNTSSTSPQKSSLPNLTSSQSSSKVESTDTSNSNQSLPFTPTKTTPSIESPPQNKPSSPTNLSP